jgi:hypothetical protein
MGYFMGEKPSGVIYTMAQAGKSSAFVVHVPIKKPFMYTGLSIATFD